MTALGAFRDDFYNAINVLPQSQFVSSTQNGGVLSGVGLAGAGDCFLSLSGQAGAQALTTDSAVNVIAQLQQAVAAAYKSAVNGFGAGVNPPSGVPNLFNVTYTLTINNFNNTSGAITLTGGTGVTITGTNTIAINNQRVFLVTITSPTTVTLTSLYSGTIAA